MIDIDLDAKSVGLMAKEMRGYSSWLKKTSRSSKSTFARTLMRLVGEFIIDNFQNEEDSNRSKWVALAPQTQAGRRKRGLQANSNKLIVTGDLMRTSSQNLIVGIQGGRFTIRPDLRRGKRGFGGGTGPFKVKFAAHNKLNTKGLLDKGEIPGREFFYLPTKRYSADKIGQFLQTVLLAVVIEKTQKTLGLSKQQAAMKFKLASIRDTTRGFRKQANRAIRGEMKRILVKHQ